MKDICAQLPSDKLSAFAPTGRFDANLLSFAAAFKSLQEKRHAADYDPEYRTTTKESDADIKAAAEALAAFRAAPSEQRLTFLGLLIFKAR